MGAYNTDYHVWCVDQAMALRSGTEAALDRDALADEIELLAGRERRELRRRLAKLIKHLLMWQYQFEYRTDWWRETIATQREAIGDVLNDSPSLRPLLDEYLATAYERGKQAALRATGLFKLPEGCPYALAQILDTEFYPDL